MKRFKNGVICFIISIIVALILSTSNTSALAQSRTLLSTMTLLKFEDEYDQKNVAVMAVVDHIAKANGAHGGDFYYEVYLYHDVTVVAFTTQISTRVKVGSLVEVHGRYFKASMFMGNNYKQFIIADKLTVLDVS